MTQRSIGIDLAIRGDHVAQIFEGGRPDAVRSVRRSALRTFIANHASGNHPHIGPFVKTLIDGLRHAARQARALHRHHVDFVELQAVNRRVKRDQIVG